MIKIAVFSSFLSFRYKPQTVYFYIRLFPILHINILHLVPYKFIKKTTNHKKNIHSAFPELSKGEEKPSPLLN